MLHRLWLASWLGAFVNVAMSVPVTAESRPAHVTWMESVDTPPWRVPATRRGWERERQNIRKTLNQLLGALPPRTRPEVRSLGTEERGTYTVERFEFDNGAGATVPGVVLVPKVRAGRLPAILYCHWHGGEYDGGKVELFETKHTPQPPGPTLVERGYVVLAIDAYCFGERNGQGPGGPTEKGSAGELTASKFELWAGRSLWGMLLRDDLMALDYLCSRPEVDPKRIGVTGISMGATRSWWLMALDERIRAGVAVACLTRYHDLIAAEGLKYHGIYYYVPGMLRHFDTEAVVALAAPRALLCLNGDRDAGSPVAGIHTIEAAVAPVWRLCGRETAFRSEVFPEVGHAYTPAMWERMLTWMDTQLRGAEAHSPR